jgi:hypothetical protein
MKKIFSPELLSLLEIFNEFELGPKEAALLIKSGFLRDVCEAVSSNRIQKADRETVRLAMGLKPKSTKESLPPLLESLRVSDLGAMRFVKEIKSPNIKRLLPDEIVTGDQNLLIKKKIKTSRKIKEVDILRFFDGCEDLNREDLINFSKKQIGSLVEVFGYVIQILVDLEEGKSLIFQDYGDMKILIPVVRHGKVWFLEMTRAFTGGRWTINLPEATLNKTYQSKNLYIVLV